jgi:hypothetical protein
MKCSNLKVEWLQKERNSLKNKKRGSKLILQMLMKDLTEKILAWLESCVIQMTSLRRENKL